MTDILDKLKQACIGHPYAKIPWPHRVLHDAQDEIRALRARVAELEAWKERRLHDALGELQRMGQAEEAGWRTDMENAPKDGTPFLTFSVDAHGHPMEGVMGYKSTPIMVMAMVPADGNPCPVNEHGDWDDWHCYEPTHWRPLDCIFPLPAPPTEGDV